jgi:homeobox protein cut-like
MERCSTTFLANPRRLTCLALDVNLSELQKTLDGQGIEIVDNQKVSHLARKALADKTKGAPPPLGHLIHSESPSSEFKKISDPEKLAAFKTLLKGTASSLYTVYTKSLISTAYQTEIDNLTQRSKFSENAFLNVYKVIAEAPDPYPLLEAAVVRAHLPTCLTSN